MKAYQHWTSSKSEMKRVAAMLSDAGKKHEAELNAGTPPDLTLRKTRRSN